MTKKTQTYSLEQFCLYIVIWELLFWCIFFACTKTNYFIEHTVLFVFPERFICLVLVLAVILLSVLSLYTDERKLNAMGQKTRSTILRPISLKTRFWRYFWFRNALVLLIISWTQPFFGTKKVQGKTRNMEVVISLDVSNSMNVCDIAPKLSRLDVAKRTMNALVNQMEGERIGVSIFASKAYTYLPLTTDYEGAKLFIEEIETKMMSSQGTNIKIALNEAYKMFSKNKNIPKTLILITDGGNHEEHPTTILKKYKKNQIQFLILGIGTRKGGPILVDRSEPSLGYKRNTLGAIVHSKLNVEFLRYIAKLGNGEVMFNYHNYPDLKMLSNKIKRSDQITKQNITFEIEKTRYQYPLALSILCLIGWRIGGIRSKKRLNETRTIINEN